MFRSLLRTCALLAAMTAPAMAEMVAFQARVDGGYVGTDGSGLLSGRAAGPQALVLDMVRLDGNRVAFRDPDSGLFLRAGVGGQTNLMVASPHIRGWETFELAQDGPDVTLRAVQNGLYVGLDAASGRLRAAYRTPSLSATYRMFPVSMQPANPPQAPQREAGRVPQSNLPFAGGWVLEDLYGVDVASDRAVRQARMTIGWRGAIDGYSGCNSFSARLLETRSAFVTDDVVTTFRRCHGDAGAVERGFYDMLNDAAHFGVAGNGLLEVRDWNGRLRARFRRG
jgi:heat shock protein HslJ